MSPSNGDRQKRLNDQIEACTLVQRFCEIQRVEIEQVHIFLHLRGTRQSLAEMRKCSLAFRKMHEDLKQLQQERRRLMQIK